ncbi:DUF2147 domain-containing protein [Acinetobacter puyangensis]|uniref:Uncharacterized conserved protein, DUF2147 family n=1 Tax=Acinetobacter puyangensis TaxID=1096779 RepID=A0A240EBB4_9GAMM|nr:DUF2147 domain-containing protein [Acinetobacter puyangensis]SNX45984.1 Uncharacterized conserved protein, DUF2147 family [Acinetobacter puyangensis]
MKKLSLLLLTAAFTTTSVFAADVLNNSEWKTIDDETGKPKALVSFKQQANGTFTATISKSLDPNVEKGCNTCAGALKGKPLEGVTIVRNLKAVSAGKYDGGTILDPKSGKSYKMKAELSPDGKKLQVRGYIGISALGRNQTWLRAN